MGEILQLQNVSKRFGSVLAVDNICLSMTAGQFFTMLGPSGCGKSTILRMVGGFEFPSEGRVIIDGRDNSRTPPNRRNVNMVFQDYALFPHLSVRKNILFGLQMTGYGSVAASSRVDEMLAMVELTPFADRMPSQLSGGQLQRVALARAMALKPAILLLDEPLSALDAKLRQEMQVRLRNLQKQTGTTFLLVTHDQEEALAMSDTVILMNKGVIQQVGSPQDLYNWPATRFVADFIGQMNILKVDETSMDGSSRVHRSGELLIRSADARDDGWSFVGIRPEKIRLVDSGVAPAPNRATGTVTDLVFLGESVALTVRVGSQPINVSAPSDEVSLKVGDVAHMAWEASAIRGLP